MSRWSLALAAFGLLSGCRTALREAPSGSASGHDRGSDHAGEATHGEHDRPPAVGGDLRQGWRAPVDHAHESRRGTPYVHAFLVEPAFLGRDLLVHAEQEGKEHSLEVEVEHALTRRLLLLPEIPYHATEDRHGVGDAGLGLRALLVETDRWLLSAQVGFELPTARRDLGAEEASVSQSLLAWGDLGSCFTAQGGLTLSAGAESGDTALSWGVALGKSFHGRPIFRGCAAHSDHGRSFLTLLLEGRGEHALSGPEEGTSEHQALLGVSVALRPGLNVRAGWTLTWAEEHDAESGWVAGFVLHL